MQVGVGGDRVLIGDLECHLGEDAAGIDSGIHQVDRGADPFGMPFRERPVSAVDSSVSRRDAGMHVDDRATHRFQHPRGDDPSSVHDDDVGRRVARRATSSRR